MPILIHLMAVGTLILDLALVLGVLTMRNRKVISRIVPHSLDLIFLLAAGGVVGALLLEYAGSLTPCLLCWWQRVFMFPIALIGGIAVAKKQKASDIADYVLAFSIPGALIALYQHFLQMAPAGTLPAPCDASGDCALRSVFEFGFVTLPWMAFTIFAALAFIAWIARSPRA